MLELNKENLPTHIAFIIDGNGRWAKMRGKERTYGHKEGVKTVKKIIENCKELGIKVCSFFVFSTENWKRPKKEVDALMELLHSFIKTDTKKYEKENIRLTTMGNLNELSSEIKEAILDAEEKTKNNTGITVNICINYGGRADIVNAVNQIIKSGVKSINEEEFSKYLYASDLPNPDLIVRTSGEYRLSNFLIWQGAYSELYFTKTYWPDFTKEDLEQAIFDYQHRERRFGKVGK